MARIYRVQVVIPMDTNNPLDAVTNTWVFDADPSTGATPTDTANDMIDRVEDFYFAIGSSIFPQQVTPTFTATAYDLADPTPRTPILERNITAATTATNALPAEVAICLSFEAERESGVNMRRRRGRVFIGPLGISVSATTSDGARPAAFATDLIRDQAQILLDSGFATSDDPKWAIYSPTSQTQGSSLEDSTNDVHHGWVDNAFDTVRSRGVAPTTRDLFTR